MVPRYEVTRLVGSLVATRMVVMIQGQAMCDVIRGGLRVAVYICRQL